MTAWGFKGNANRALELPAGQSTDVSPGGRARIRFNETLGRLEESIDGAAYVPVGSGAIGGGWTDEGTTVRLTTVTDGVAVGAAAMSGTEKIRIVGGALFEVPDDDANAFIVTQGGNNYIEIGTEDGAELMLLGSNRVSTLTTVVWGSLIRIGTAADPARVAFAIPDNDGTALGVTQGGDSYIDIDTTDNAEQLVLGNSTLAALSVVLVGNEVAIGAPAAPTDVTITIDDNSTPFTIKEGANEYVNIVTTDGSEVLELMGGPSGDVHVGVTGTGEVKIAGAGTVLGFFGAGGSTQPTVNGALSTVADAAAKAVLTSIIAALESAAGVGLFVDGTT
jgi:hypothetical protein